MNMHMSMSIRTQTASPRKSPLVISIRAAVMRLRLSTTVRSQRSMVARMTIAGSSASSAR